MIAHLLASGSRQCAVPERSTRRRGLEPAPEVSANGVMTVAPRIAAAFGGSRSIMGRTSPAGQPLFIALAPHAGSGGGLPQPVSAPQDMGKQRARHRHLGQLEDEVGKISRPYPLLAEIPRMPTSEGDLAPFQHARQGRKGRNVGSREPGGADAAFRGCVPHLASVEQFPGRSWPRVACWIVIVHRSRSSCRERRRLWSEPIDPAQDVGEQRSWHRYLSELEHHVAAVVHDPGADLHQPS